MSSPTIIRHASTGGLTALVATYFEKEPGLNNRNIRLMAAFQVYETGGDNDYTRMISSSPWTSEQGAMNEFEDWVQEQVG